MKASSESRRCGCGGGSLLAVLVLLAVGGEALGLQQLGSSAPLAEDALLVVEEFLLFLQSRLLICMEALQLLETALQLERGEDSSGSACSQKKRELSRAPPTSLSASFSSASFSFTL